MSEALQSAPATVGCDELKKMVIAPGRYQSCTGNTTVNLVQIYIYSSFFSCFTQPSGSRAPTDKRQWQSPHPLNPHPCRER